MPGIGAPGVRSDKSHMFIKYMGEDNRKHSLMCRKHAGRTVNTELGFKTISVGSGEGLKPTRWFSTRMNINSCTLVKKKIKFSKNRIESTGLGEMEPGGLIDHKFNI